MGGSFVRTGHAGGCALVPAPGTERVQPEGIQSGADGDSFMEFVAGRSVYCFELCDSGLLRLAWHLVHSPPDEVFASRLGFVPGLLGRQQLWLAVRRLHDSLPVVFHVGSFCRRNRQAVIYPGNHFLDRPVRSFWNRISDRPVGNP